MTSILSTHAHTHMHARTRMHARTHTHTHIHTHTRTHTHTHTRTQEDGGDYVLANGWLKATLTSEGLLKSVLLVNKNSRSRRYKCV